MDRCLMCPNEFRRKYRRGGERKVYCSKSCHYRAMYVDLVCPTCNAPFRTNLLSRRKTYCSLACIERSPCLLCGKIITGRAKFQGGARRFCSHSCANYVNRTMAGKGNYVVRGFAAAIQRKGSLQCETCGDPNTAHLVVHHVDRNRQNNTPANLITLCANCHMEHHWQKSASRTNVLRLAHRWKAIAEA